MHKTSVRKAFTLLLFFYSTIVWGQETKNWQISLQLQPELTIHKNDYSGFYGKTYMKTSFNGGVAALVQKNFTENIFIEGGGGFISRRINAGVFIDQARMFPSPSGLFTDDLIMPQRVSYRIFQLPLGLGVNLLKTERTVFFAKGTIIPQFLLNTKYGSGDKYVFDNNYWQGLAMNAGLGFDYKLSDKYCFTNAVSYSVKNTVKKDYYTFSQNADEIAITHTFLQLSTGIKINL
jgi:hypothetical protein